MNVPVNTVLMNAPFRGLEQFRSVYFIGIGGIGMSAIARFFKEGGVEVSGYDKTPTPLTKELEKAGIKIHYEDDISQLPKQVDLVIYTPAIPADHKELNYYQAERNVRLVKRSDVLKLITESSFNICIAGTHGKTTITTMVAHLLRHTGFGCNAFLGGISGNYGTNFWSSERNVCVVEADEYDRSFLKLSPDIAVITAMDADHLDIYGTAEAVEQAFIDFSGCVKKDGMLIRQFGLKQGSKLKGDYRFKYSLQNDEADYYAENIVIKDGGYHFDMIAKDDRINGLTLNMGGMHNVENSIAAIAVASSLNIDKDKIREALAAFKGVKRRFDYIIQTPWIAFIDDYAHHPEELKALIVSAKNLFKQRKCTILFQPHLFSRTRDFADEFAAALDLADQVILLPIYPARELPIEGVTSQVILDRMKLVDKRTMTKEQVLLWIENDYQAAMHPDFGSIFITAGAGDIDTLIEPIKKSLLET